MQRSPPADDIHRTVSVLPIEGRGLVFERGGRRIIDGVDVSLGAAPRTLAIVGPNGAGKSVLLRLLVGLIAPDSGEVTWAGAAPSRACAHRLGFVFQKPVLLRRSVHANVLYALTVAGCEAAKRGALAEEALAAAGLGHLARNPARVLSGGEQQRLSIARALATRPELLVLDEPTANLDPASTAAIESVIRDVRAAGTGVVLVTHDLGQARRIADDVMFMHCGRIVEQGPAQSFFASPRTAEARSFLAGELVL
ncbi:MAG TPA: ATP-binding cassette domain-containing protein [Hyphomicrobiaceae bacterium]|nr:ATP-binding cassette domain-containing protein [Hyphomicrobiaceae bacterium]